MEESFVERRKRELEAASKGTIQPSTQTTSQPSAMSFVERRKMELDNPNYRNDTGLIHGPPDPVESEIVEPERSSGSSSWEKKPFLAQIQSDIYDNTIGPVADKFMRAATSSVDALLPGNQREQMKQAPDYQRQIFGQALEPAQTTADEVADFAGSMYGATPGILGAYKVGGKILSKVGSKLPSSLTNKITSVVDDIGRVNGIGNASNLASMATRGASAGTVYGTAREGIEAARGEEQSIGGRLGDIATDAALFGAGDALFGVAGKGIQQIGEKYKGSKLNEYINSIFHKTPEADPVPVVEQAGDPLALPLGRGDQRIQSARERANQPYPSDVIAPANDIPANALPASRQYAEAQATLNGIQKALPESQRYNRIQQRRADLPPGTEPIAPYGESPTLALPESQGYAAAQRLKSQQPLALPESQRYAAMQERMNRRTPEGETIAGRGGASEPFGLPEGNYTQPQRLKILNDAESMLNRVRQQIKPEVEQMIAVPARRDLLINYIQKYTNVPVEEIRNLPMSYLQSLGQDVRKGINIPEIAFQVASKYGHDLPALFEGKLPTAKAKITRDAQARTAGVYPDNLPKAKAPQGFNSSVRGQAQSPKEVIKSNQPRRTVQEKPAPETENSAAYKLQRAAQQLDMTARAKQINDLTKPIIGRVSAPENSFAYRPKKSSRKTNVPESKRTVSEPPKEPENSAAYKLQRATQQLDMTGRMIRAKELTKPIIGRAPTLDQLTAVGRGNQPIKPVGEKPKTTVLRNSSAQKPTNSAKNTNSPQQQRGFAETLKESDKTPQGFKDLVKSGYKPLTNKDTLATANKRIDADLEDAASYVMGKSRASAEKTAVALRLVDEFNKKGEFARAASIVEKYAPELTQAGQAGQAVAMFERLSPEGVLLYAQKIANKTNELIPLGVKEVKITPKMAEGIYELATVSRKMQGVKEFSNDVQNILDKAKTGEKLTETEATALKTFVQESKQFIKEAARPPRAPRPPQEPKDKRVRDNVVSFLDAQEQAARDRIKARGQRLSSTPLDVYADYAIIGAAKMAKGTIKFTEWSAAMVKDFGEELKPQLQHLYERSVQAFNQSAKTVSKQTISEAEKLAEKVIKTKELTGPQVDSIRTLAQKVSRLAGDDKIIASQDLQQILQTLERPGILRKISSTQTIGQLLNPKTQVRNAVGNELFYRVERLNKLLATPIDIARSKLTGGERTVTFRTNNQGEYWKNWMRGGKAGWNGVNVQGLQTAYDLGSPAFTGKWNPMTYMEKSLGAALKSFDTAAYMRAYNNTVGEMATLRAINEGKRGNKDLIQKYIREADDNVMKIADEYGKYVTFQDNNAISKALVGTKRALNVGKDFGLGDLVLKYPKTPGALLMRALEYSPAGFIRSGMQLARPFFKKEPNTKEATEALTRAMMGTFGFSGMGYFLMDKGIVTGSASKDKDVRDLQKSAGQGQYQVNLSALSRFIKSGFDPSSTKLQQDDYMYTYDWMQPISIAASMGANVSKNMGEGKSKLEGLAGTIYNSAEGGLSTLTEQSVLSGLKSATQIYPGQTVADKIADILTDIPSSFIPTYLNQIKQLGDNSKPETFSPDKIERGINKAKAKIPGLADNLPKQFDTLGRPRENYQNNNAFNVLMNPGFSSNYELSPEAKYVIDLMNESDDETVAPRVPGKKITVDGQSMQLNGDQFSRLQELQGLAQKKEIGKLSGNGSLNKRVERDQEALTKAGAAARKQLVKEFPELKPPKAK